MLYHAWALFDAVLRDPGWGRRRSNSNIRAPKGHFNLMQSLAPDGSPRGTI